MTFVFFFKQKTAYELRSSDWSSDVCSSDLAKTRHGGVDFGDLIMLPAKLLETDAAIRTAVQLRHRHVLVDEYQDVNRASARLLKAVVGDGERLWVVGDSRLSIYRRSAGRRVGKECVRTWRSRWSPYH